MTRTSLLKMSGAVCLLPWSTQKTSQPTENIQVGPPFHPRVFLLSHVTNSAPNYLWRVRGMRGHEFLPFGTQPHQGTPQTMIRTAVFTPVAQRGWILAFAHVRGGSEMGDEWYRQGKLLHKGTSSDALPLFPLRPLV